MKLLRLLPVAALLFVALSACGQKGPLYLPDADSGETSPVTVEEDGDDDGA